MEMYENHNVFVRVTDSFLQPIRTSIGLKQGCGISPILFNTFINKLPTVNDQSCDQVQLGGRDMNCLLWADDLMVVSKSAEGLQAAIDKTFQFKKNRPGYEHIKNKSFDIH